MRSITLFIATLFIFIGCQTTEPAGDFSDGLRYRVELTLQDSAILPFIMTKRGEMHYILHNGREKIHLQKIHRVGDSIHISFPVYQTYLRFVQDGEYIRGYFSDRDKGEDHRIPLTGKFSDVDRFPNPKKNMYSINHPWEVIFRPGEEKERRALGEFFQKDETVRGSILSPSGDYRFLEGVMDGDELKLATFDGKFTYLFKATLKDGELDGYYYPGIAEPIRWKAHRNDTFSLPNPSANTFLKDANLPFDFTFEDQNGKKISPKKGKVNLIQVMGTWCPNCSDESKLLEKWHQQYGDRGLHVIGLAFELSDDPESAWPAIDKMKTDLQLNYPIAFAGRANPESTSKALPMLNRISAYPTLVIIDRKGKVRDIHSGFYGPGTTRYDSYSKDMRKLIEELLAE